VDETDSKTRLQARDPSTQKSVGEFMTDTSDVTKAKAFDCHSTRRSSLTHNDASLKNSIIAKWKAPYTLANNTELRFYYTVVRDFNTFWVRQESQAVIYHSGAEAVAAQGPILQNSISAENFSYNFSSLDFGLISTKIITQTGYHGQKP
jgi:hypothetical protein